MTIICSQQIRLRMIMSFIMRNGGRFLTDHEIAVVGLGVAILAGVGTWLGLPQLQGWWKVAIDAANPVTLGDLSPIASLQLPVPPGLLADDRATLERVLKALPSARIDSPERFWERVSMEFCSVCRGVSVALYRART